MSSSSPEAPSSPREGGGDFRQSPTKGDEDEVQFQDIQLTYRDEFANEVLVFTSLDDFQCGIKMTRFADGGEGAGDIFQCLVSFPPGNHTYRYLVDGEWMCDEIKEVKYVMGNAYNEIEVDAPNSSQYKVDQSAVKRKEKRKRWRQKKKMAKAKRKALVPITDGKDGKSQNKQLSETLKSIENMATQKLVAAEDRFANEKEELKARWRTEREQWIARIKGSQEEAQQFQKDLADVKGELEKALESQKLTQLESQQLQRRSQELEKIQATLGGEKAEAEKREREAQEENKTLKRKMKTVKGELQAKFEKQIEDVTAAMEAELRNTSVNIFYLKKEIEKHKQAQEEAEKRVDVEKKLLEVTKKEKDALAVDLANQKAELASLTTKLSEVKTSGATSSRELTEVQSQLEKLQEKHKQESAQWQQKQEELKHHSTTLATEKDKVTEAETKAKEEIKKLKDLNYKLQTELTTNQASFESELQDLKAKLQAEVESTKAEKSTVEKKMEVHLQSKAQEVQSVVTRLEELKKERDDLIASHEKETAELTARSKTLTEEKDKVELELVSTKGELKALTEAKADLETKLSHQIAELKGKIAQLGEEKEQLETNNKKAHSDFLALQQNKESLESTFKQQESTYQSDLAALTKKYEEEVKTTGTLNSELDKEKKSKEKVAAQATALDQLIKDLEKEKASMTEDHKQAIAELETKLSQANSRISSQEASLEQTKNHLEKSKEELKNREQAFTNEIQEVKKQFDASKDKLNQIRKKIKEVSGESRELGAGAQALKMAQIQAASGTSKALALFEKTVCRSIEQYSKLLEETLQKYKKEMTERRKYFNLVQELRGNIRVSIRARPMIDYDSKRQMPDGSASTMALKFPDSGVISINKGGKNTEYEFDRVFSTTETQAEIFADTSQLIRSVMDGYNVCIIAYGQTGSGKTFTMEGPEEDPGVNFRALKELFLIKKKRAEDYVYEISVSMLEIYNETLCDLLVEKSDENKLNIRQGKDGIYVENLTEVEVETEADVLKYFHVGKKNRASGKTNMNEHSSRSHSILTVSVQGHNFTAGITYFGKLHLIDLAGSERVSRSGATGERLKEAQAINKSLSALGNVLHNLQLKSKHIPYRDSKLTYLLQDSLGGNSKCMMFVNLSPCSADAEETFCSLEFAARVSRVELGQASQNKIRKGEAGPPGSEPLSPAGKDDTKTAPGAKAAPGQTPKPGAPDKKAKPGVTTPGAPGKPATKSVAGTGTTPKPGTGAAGAVSPAPNKKPPSTTTPVATKPTPQPTKK